MTKISKVTDTTKRWFRECGGKVLFDNDHEADVKVTVDGNWASVQDRSDCCDEIMELLNIPLATLMRLKELKEECQMLSKQVTYLDEGLAKLEDVAFAAKVLCHSVKGGAGSAFHWDILSKALNALEGGETK